MQFRFALSALVAAGLSTFGMTHDADACGACISPPTQSTVVTGHRMALSISPKQTVLWDQIEYAGAPDSFAWVLPVKPGAIIQLSTDAWFDTLDAATTTQIIQPQVSCGGDASFGCGGTAKGAPTLAAEGASSSCPFCDGDSNGASFVPPPVVTVVSRGSVGPYSMVTLSTDTPGALNTWLTDNGFALDPATQPVVDAYVAEGFDFIALKLLPEKDVSAMKPVRVVQSGANPTLPLRMVAIGTGANVAMTLFVISEGRWEAKEFQNVIVPPGLVAWDFKDDSTNYGELREKVLGQNGGATWLTAFAFQGALLSPLPGAGSMGFGFRNYSIPSASIFATTISSAYIQQGIANGETADDTCLKAMESNKASGLMVTNPCPLDKPFNDPSCGIVGPKEVDARTFICGSLEPMDTRLDDVAVALNGLHPADVWITRIEANLPRAALKDDLVVQPAALQSTVDNLKQAANAKNVDVFCGSTGSVVPPGVSSDRSGPKGPGNLVVLVGLGLLSLAALARRRSTAYAD